MVSSAYLGNLVYWVSGVLHSTSHTNWGQPSKNRVRRGAGHDRGNGASQKRKDWYQSVELQAFLGKSTLFGKKLSFEGMARREVTFF